MEYGRDVLADDRRHRREVPVVTLRRGLVLEVLGDGFVGEVVAVRGRQVVLRDRRGRERGFTVDDTGFVLDDRPVRVRVPDRPAPTPSAPRTTPSGSIAVDHAPRQARASRIFVEGTHDAELVEKVWGDDLRWEGVVVEVLDGVDDLDGVVRAFAPGPSRRMGVLVDHLVPGSKESRVVASISHPHVLVTGHPFVDVWAAVRPEVVGLPAWPDVPHGTSWKAGICAALGEDEPGVAWRRILGAVTSWHDLDRSLVHAVERLVDFCTETAA